MNWIGELPTDWKTVPVKRLAAIYNGATPKSGVDELWNGDINWFTPTDLDNDGVTELSESSRKLTRLGLNSCAAQIAPAGSVVLSSRAPVGSVGVTTLEAATNQGCRTLAPFNNYPPKLLANTLLAAREQLQLASNGTTFLELSTRALADFKLPVPPASEWSVLLDHLNRATTRIDALVAKKTRFIELLREKRQALITHAVTKGLDRRVAMKDSGVEWLGKVPAHWSIQRAKYLFTLAQRPPRPEDGIVTAFRDGEVTLRSNRRTDGFTNAIKEAGYQGVRKGDLVIHAMDAFAGAIGVSDSDGKCTPVYSCCVPKQGATSDYYARCVRTMATTGYIESLAKGIRERSTDFRWATFAEQVLPKPPEDEQLAIGHFLDRATTRIDALVAKTERSIELLREHRTALITAAVTGKIDLRPAT